MGPALRGAGQDRQGKAELIALAKRPPALLGADRVKFVGGKCNISLEVAQRLYQRLTDRATCGAAEVKKRR